MPDSSGSVAATTQEAWTPSAPRGPLGLPTLEDLPSVAGHRVLVRADLNAPLSPSAGGTYEVADDFRLRSSVPTLEWLVANGAEVSVCSHLGRPKGKVDARYEMSPVRRAMAALVPGLEVLENLRFDPGEEANDPAFVLRLVEGFDFFVNDAFGACHRGHASIVGPPTLLPSAAGRLLEHEVEALVDPRRSEATVRRRRRRGEGRRQAGGAQIPGRTGRPPSARWRHVLHLSRVGRPRGRPISHRA